MFSFSLNGKFVEVKIKAKATAPNPKPIVSQKYALFVSFLSQPKTPKVNNAPKSKQRPPKTKHIIKILVPRSGDSPKGKNTPLKYRVRKTSIGNIPAKTISNDQGNEFSLLNALAFTAIRLPNPVKRNHIPRDRP